jgi:hypothetical protein
MTHVVLFRPRADLTRAQAGELLDSFTRAARVIPSVQAVRVGRRVMFGYAYESIPQPDYHFMVELDFADAEGLQAYLTHPLHADLASRFYAAVAEGHAYDMATVVDVSAALDAV